MKKISLMFAVLLPFFCYTQIQTVSQYCIPMPNMFRVGEGQFLINPQTKIVIPNSSLVNDCSVLINHIEKNFGFKLQIVNAVPTGGNYIQFLPSPGNAMDSEKYELVVLPDKITIRATPTGAGFFYGMQTILQLLPLAQQMLIAKSERRIPMQCITVKDEPRFKWRGMHLDVSRHFFSVDFVKKYMDILAMYKMNTFHWHLTDDQGWRIEIKKYPLLTEVGSQRSGSMIGPYSEQKVDSRVYAGYYTQEQIKEVVAYAKTKHITIVPEIEMPGHSQAAIASYPWLSCSGKKIETAKGWGVFEDVFCTKDSTFLFLQSVLDEVIALFPGKYIHIGGDECPKTRWKECPKCQGVMKRENLKNENELQSYFVKRIANYLKSKSKSIIGWDEIMEGGLAPGAAVMSWRGTEGGIEAAHLHHDVVMTPGDYCYFDHYQSRAQDEPTAIGGYTPLEKVYAFEPVAQNLSVEEQKYIIGAQANVWTEYITTEKECEYMIAPRMAAMAEVLWTNKENKNLDDFLLRVQNHLSLLKIMNINYSTALYDVNFNIEKNNSTNTLQLYISYNKALGVIFYTTDNSLPTLDSKRYEGPIDINTTTNISAALCARDLEMQRLTSKMFYVSLATCKTPSFSVDPSKYYNSGGGFTLVNGIKARLPRLNNEWLGWSGNDMEATIDLGAEKDVSEIEADFLKEEVNWIYLPKEVTFLISEDGKTFQNVGVINKLVEENKKSAVSIGFKKQKARYVRIIAKNAGKITAGKPGAGEDCWLFCDEILVH